MAKPKVFISSTCYDFREIRDSLSTFVRSLGFEPILSEYGDVFYHPDLHTHDACINEVGNCQLFVFIIGGRFGGEYIYDKKKSITNAEYEAAVQKKIPVFTYIKRGVLDNHQTFQTNKDKDIINEIHFPSIENQDDGAAIFDFINRVRRAPVNNGYEPFETSRDIESHLRKQWAGMLFDFLKNREVADKITNTNEAVHEIRGVSDKLEALLKNVYRVVDRDNADEKINDIEVNLLAKEYLERMIGDCFQGGRLSLEAEEYENIISVNPKNYNWYKYLEKIGLFVYAYEDDEDINYDISENIYLKLGSNFSVGYDGIAISKGMPTKYENETNYMYENGFKEINSNQRRSLLKRYYDIPE